MKIIISGIFSKHHMGSYLSLAAQQLSHQVFEASFEEASSKLKIINQLWWHFAFKRYSKPTAFQDKLLELCDSVKPDVMIVTGISPLNTQTISHIKRRKIKIGNYLTDNPFSNIHYRKWFVNTLGSYDYIFNPRLKNLDQLKMAGCKYIKFIPFGYDKQSHKSGASDTEKVCDVVFLGHADQSRINIIQTLVAADFNIRIYGGGWSDRVLRQSKIPVHMYHGFAYGKAYADAVSMSKLSLCLTRHDNEDNHSMRTFELAAMKSCMLVEETDYHKEIFGDDLDAVAYFADAKSLIKKIKYLINNPELRELMGRRAQSIVYSRDDSYENRINQMVNALVGVNSNG